MNFFFKELKNLQYYPPNALFVISNTKYTHHTRNINAVFLINYTVRHDKFIFTFLISVSVWKPWVDQYSHLVEMYYFRTILEAKSNQVVLFSHRIHPKDCHHHLSIGSFLNNANFTRVIVIMVHWWIATDVARCGDGNCYAPGIAYFCRKR